PWCAGAPTRSSRRRLAGTSGRGGIGPETEHRAERSRGAVMPPDEHADDFADEPTLPDVILPEFAQATAPPNEPQKPNDAVQEKPVPRDWPQSPAEARERMKRASPLKKRELPLRARLAIVGAGLLLVVIILCGRGGAGEKKTPTLSVPEDIVVSADDLKKR